jgi:bifunctional DNA-binding transcriptional regulator/antitoxin component of YhaV-PrlF toxin-antitoxin module
MAKVTTKLQVTIPRVVAERYGIEPGDEIEWLPAGDSIRVIPQGRRRPGRPVAERLALFDAATRRRDVRQREVNVVHQPETAEPPSRGWNREELYRRGGAR